MTSIQRTIAVLGVLLALFGCASNGRQSTVGAYLDDAAITARVKTAIFNEKALPVTKISVTTEDRVVQLTGNVATPTEKRKAGEVASKVPGVRRVVNALGVEKK